MPQRHGDFQPITVRHESPHVKIIALTGGAGEPDLLKVAKLLGAHLTMKKPIEMTELQKAVQQELQEGPLRKEPGPQDTP